MTTSVPIEERLLYHREDQATGKMVLRNEDGPEAADTIARLRAALEESEALIGADVEATASAIARAAAAEAELSSLKARVAELEFLHEFVGTDPGDLTLRVAAGTRADGIEAAAEVIAAAEAESTWHRDYPDLFIRDLAKRIRALSPASPKPVVGEIVKWLKTLTPSHRYDTSRTVLRDIADDIASRFGKEGG